MTSWTCGKGHVDQFSVRRRTGRQAGQTWNECRVCVRDRQNADYAADPAKGRLKVKEWRAANPEKVVADRESRKEYHRQKSAEWYRRNKDFVIQKTRLRKLKLDQGDLTPAQWRTIVELASGCCLRCGQDDRPLTVDHIVPLSRNGKHTLTNVQPLCDECNKRKFTKSTDYRPLSWAVN
jgi:5-methylcytosine-specific restriction endonuclease McrA